jgi:hypothetical protein
VTEPATRATRTSTFVLSVTALALALSAGFFPTYFKGITSYDDEGSLLITVRQFLRHGSLYVHTHGDTGRSISPSPGSSSE